MTMSLTDDAVIEPTHAAAGEDEPWMDGWECCFVVSPEGRVTALGGEVREATGVDGTQVLGRSVEDWVAPEARGTVAELLDAARRGIRGRRRLTLCTGALAIATAFPGSDGTFVTLRDAGPFSRFAMQVEERERFAVIGEATVRVTHTLNNIQTPIISAASLLRQPGLSDAKRTRYLETLLTSVQQAASVLSPLLSMGRTEIPPMREATSDERETTDLADVAHRVMALKATELREQNIRYVITPTTAQPLAHARCAHIERIVGALVDNAIEAMAAMPRGRPRVLTIDIGQVDESVTVRVQDTGGGVAASVIERIFEPGVTTKGGGRGAGNGLAIARSLARKNGGTITLHNIAGVGAQFVLALPAVTDGTASDHPVVTLESQGAPVADAPLPVEVMARVVNRRVLLVDDDRSVRTTSAEALRQIYRVNVIDVASGDEALAAVQEGGPGFFDAVILDVRMPGKDGRAIFRELQKIDPDLARRVIFMFGDRVEGALAHFLRTVQAPHVPKPASPATVVQVLADVLDRRVPASSSSV